MKSYTTLIKIGLKIHQTDDFVDAFLLLKCTSVMNTTQNIL